MSIVAAPPPMMADANTRMMTSIIELFFFTGSCASAGICAVPARITGLLDDKENYLGAIVNWC